MGSNLGIIMTKGEIDRLGERIGKSTGSISESDLKMLQEYRATFQRPIAEVFAFANSTARKIDKQCIVTYRIKRIDTIIEKLRRFSDSPEGAMQFSRMWDIAGCRCIMNSPDNTKLYQLLSAIKTKYGQQCKVKDYIENPRESGYRSIHIYVKDENTGKPVEIQIRNKQQHNWATLVEILDLLYGTQNKEYGQTGQLGEFLYLYSRKDKLTDKEFAKLIAIEKGKKIFEKMSSTLTSNYLNTKSQWLKQQFRGSYYVIEANKTASTIESFPSFEEAEQQYYFKYVNKKDSNIVLTHLSHPTFEQISMAYSNYVLSMHDFIDEYRTLISSKIVESVRKKKYWLFRKQFKIYFRNLRCHFKNLRQEATKIENCEQSAGIKKTQLNKWKNDVIHRINTWKVETRDFLKLLATVSYKDSLYRWLIRRRIRKMGKIVSES